MYSHDISGRGVGIRIKPQKKKVMETRKRKFIMSWVSYVTICSFLAVVNYMTCREYAWVLWVMGGWGLGQLIETADYLLARSERTEEHNR